jgi:hypothetical protein
VRSERGRSPLSFSFPLSHTGFIVLAWKKLCERGIKGVSIKNRPNISSTFLVLSVFYCCACIILAVFFRFLQVLLRRVGVQEGHSPSFP